MPSIVPLKPHNFILNSLFLVSGACGTEQILPRIQKHAFQRQMTGTSRLGLPHDKSKFMHTFYIHTYCSFSLFIVRQRSAYCGCIMQMHVPQINEVKF